MVFIGFLDKRKLYWYLKKNVYTWKTLSKSNNKIKNKYIL